MLAQLKIFFPDVTIAKPKSSRNSSIEAFVLCRRFSPPPGFRPEALQGLLDQACAAQVCNIWSTSCASCCPLHAACALPLPCPASGVSHGKVLGVGKLPRAVMQRFKGDAACMHAAAARRGRPQHACMHACAQDAAGEQTPEERLLVPFLACGDLAGYDADQSYDLPEGDYTFLQPVQAPTAPAYRTALELKRGGGAHMKSDDLIA
jgi:tRNA (cytidine32/guanosine34-2'-O)-methyltransferase